MKTFLEQLQHNVSPSYNFREILDNLTDDQIINEVNDYATEVAKEALMNAAVRFSEGCFNRCEFASSSEIDDIENENNIPKL